tara:strand:- start:9220 stop:10149 length:930 start_codon:yes stop_codon:yes gene_type:complete
MSANPVRIPALRIGVIGAGRWGRNVIRTIQSLPGTQLDAVVSNNPNTAELVGDNCRVHQDVQSLLNGEKLDGIAICTPPATHFDIAHDILDAGIPIFIEKPLTFDPTQADTLVRLAAAVGTWGMVDHIHLFSGAFQKLLTALPDIGEVTAIKSIAGNAGPVRADADVLWDWGPHDVAMMLSILNEPVRADSETKSLPGGAAEVTLRIMFPGDIHATAVLSNGRENRIREFSVEGTKGTLRYIDGGPERRCVLETREKSKTLLVEAAKPLTTALGSFVACIQNVTPPLSNLAFGAEVVRILAVADGREAL